MSNRRLRAFADLELNQPLKTSTLIYISLNLVIFTVSVIFFLVLGDSLHQNGNSASAIIFDIIASIFWPLNLVGLALIFILWRRYYGSHSRTGRQIASALEKMSQGDLGWKITLQRGSELAEVADSASKASESLADRITNLRIKTIELSEVESFLYDSLECDGALKPHTVKALRKLKICINRLKSDVDDFQLSSTGTDEFDQGMSHDDPVTYGNTSN